MTPTLTDAIFAPSLATDPAQPLLTFYNDISGERTELSALTAANWAAKTANMIRDEFGAIPGTPIAVDLPVHWQTAAIMLGAWWAGCDVLLGPGQAVDIAFCARDRADDHSEADEVVVARLDAFARGYTDLPPGISDYANTVRVHGDRFSPSGQPAALEGMDIPTVTARARLSAATTNISAGDRVMSARDWSTADEVIDNLVAVFISGASLVQVVGADISTLDKRAATEKVTVTIV